MLTIIKKVTPIILFSFALGCTILSCASSSANLSKAPLWVTDINAVYPDSDYLGAVGYAQDRTGAEAAAVSNISKILKQKVESQSTASQKYEDNLTDLNREYETSVTTSSLIDEITGVKIQEVWNASKNEVYALSLIDRDEVGRYYTQKIKDNENAINGLLNFMIDNEATFEGVAACQNALEVAMENDTYLELLAVINPTMYKNLNLSYKSTSAVAVLLQLEKEKIYVGVYVTGDVDERVSSALSKAFKETGYKSETLSTFAGPSTTMPYVLYGELSVSPFTMTSSQDNKYVRFTLNTELVDMKNKTFLPWSISGREAHLTETEAAQRAIRTIEQEIEKEFQNELSKLAY